MILPPILVVELTVFGLQLEADAEVPYIAEAPNKSSKELARPVVIRMNQLSRDLEPQVHPCHHLRRRLKVKRPDMALVREAPEQRRLDLHGVPPFGTPAVEVVEHEIRDPGQAEPPGPWSRRVLAVLEQAELDGPDLERPEHWRGVDESLQYAERHVAEVQTRLGEPRVRRQAAARPAEVHDLAEVENPEGGRRREGADAEAVEAVGLVGARAEEEAHAEVLHVAGPRGGQQAHEFSHLQVDLVGQRVVVFVFSFHVPEASFFIGQRRRP